jgi:hypothetical protein
VRSVVGGKSETNRITCWEIYVPDNEFEIFQDLPLHWAQIVLADVTIRR